MQILQAGGPSQAWAAKSDFLSSFAGRSLFSGSYTLKELKSIQAEKMKVGVFRASLMARVTQVPTYHTYNPIGLCSVFQESACFFCLYFSLVFEEILCLCKP